MQVLLTIALLAAAAAWFAGVYRRLGKMRHDVKAAWQLLEQNQTNEAAKTVYNKRVAAYNAMLAAFPANIVAAISGFRPANRF